MRILTIKEFDMYSRTVKWSWTILVGDKEIKGNSLHTTEEEAYAAAEQAIKNGYVKF